MTSTVRVALFCSVSSAAAMLFPIQGALAQSTTCSETGDVITCTDGATTVLTANTTSNTVTVPPPAPGLTILAPVGPAATTTYTATGPIATTNAPGVQLASPTGPLTFIPAGTTAPVAISTTGGVGANALTISAPGQSANVTVGALSTTGANSFGARVLTAGNLTLRTGNVTTTGTLSGGILANTTGFLNLTAGDFSTTDRAITASTFVSQNANVTAGNITSATSGVLVNGGSVSINTGNVTTANGFGVIGQSLGGTGGVFIRTGNVSSTNGFGVGGTVFNTTGGVEIICGNVTSTSPTSAAVFAQNNGTGTLSVNCGAVSNVGNNGVFVQSFGAPNGGNILINTTSVTNSDTAFSTIFAETNGSGGITVNAGTVTGGSLGGVGAIGIDLASDFGAIDVGYGNVTTVGTALDAFTSNIVTVRGAGSTLRTSGAGATAAVITSGGLQGNLGNIVTTGAGAQGLLFTGPGPVNLTVGNVATTGNGVTINAGSNPVTLTTGTVTATEAGATGTVVNGSSVTFNGGRQVANGANALRIAAGAGAINATVAGASTTGTGTAVAISGSGPLTFNNTAAITTVGANSSGLTISGVTTAAVTCGNVSTTGANSPAVVVAANGTTNVNCGTVTTTGAASDAIVVSNTAGTTTVTGATTSATGAGSRGIVVASSAPAATGAVTVNTGVVTANGNAVVASSTGGANVVVNATGNVTSTTGTGISATTAGSTQVTIAAGTTTTGVQGVNLQGTAGNTLVVNGTLRNTAGTTTPYTVRAGGPFTLTLGANGTIVGPLAFTTGNDTFNNQGTFALPAALDFLAGTDVLNNSGTLTAFTGTSVVSNLETFNNVGGLIDMRDNAGNDVVNFANSNYVATGAARVGIDAVGTGGTIVADRLIVGGTTTGTTTLLTNFINPVVDPTGALVVDSTLNNLTAGQYALTGTTRFGFANYALQVRSGDLFLVSTPDARIADTLLVGRQLRDLWYKSADAYSSYAIARRIDFGTTRTSPVGIWAQLYGQRQTAGDADRTLTVFGSTLAAPDRVRTNYKGAQGGIDFGGANFVIGLTGGYAKAATPESSATQISTEAHNYGAYAQFGMGTGFYAGALIKRDEYKTLLGNSAIQAAPIRPESDSTGIEGEVGFRTGGEGTINFDVGAAFAYVRADLDTFSFGNVDFDADRVTSKRGRVHARATFAGDVAPFIEVRGFRDFGDRNSYVLESGSTVTALDGSAKDTWGRVEAGLGGGAGGGALVSGWVDFGDRKGLGLRAGFRF